jgi:hypothetical protein
MRETARSLLILVLLPALLTFGLLRRLNDGQTPGFAASLTSFWRAKPFTCKKCLFTGAKYELVRAFYAGE